MKFAETAPTTYTAGPDGQLACHGIVEAFHAEYSHQHGEVGHGKLSGASDEFTYSCMHVLCCVVL